MLLGEVEEITTIREVDEETYEEIIKNKRSVPYLFVRGDAVTMISPYVRKKIYPFLQRRRKKRRENNRES